MPYSPPAFFFLSKKLITTLSEIIKVPFIRKKPRTWRTSVAILMASDPLGVSLMLIEINTFLINVNRGKL